MGILNVTPDSFSGDGILQPQADITEDALSQARRFAAAGMDILDIGAESTRPGSQPLPEAQELDRLIPVVEAVSRELDVLISVDTYKARVAEAALEAGANWINDVWALRADPAMAEVAARSGVPLVLMHNRSKPAEASLEARLGGRYIGSQYDNLIEDIKNELAGSVDLALKAGVQSGNIILDPGIGFGKTLEQNLEIIRRMNEFKTLGYPVLAGPSRKGFIGYTLNLPTHERMEGTAAAVAICIDRGADIVRVHDVEAMIRVARMTDAIVRSPS
jgi:dihydropteroate synthase